MVLNLSHNVYWVWDRDSVVMSDLTLSCVTLEGCSLTFSGIVFPLLTVMTMMTRMVIVVMVVVVIMMMMMMIVTDTL